MRVHRITVRDVKGVRESTVDFPESGVLVVEGPNEVGKSTLLEAFDKLLDPRYKATSTSREIKRLQPVGRDVGPFVEAELTVGGHRVRYAKRWLRQPMTTLEVLAPAPEQLTGEAAHARVERLLADSLDRTLWEALRLAQSDDGSVAPLADSAVLSAALDAAAGSELHAEGGEQLLDLVEKEYLASFTRTGRPTGDYKRAMLAYTEAQDHVGEAHRRLEEAAQLLARLEAAREAAAVSAELLGSARADHGSAEEAVRRAETLAEAHVRAGALLGQARERARAITHDRRQRAELAALADRLGQERAETESGREEDQTALEELLPLLTAGDEAVQRADEDLERAEQVCDLARADVDHLVHAAQADELGRLVERVEAATARLADARARVPERPVGESQVRRARDLQHRVELLTAQHEAASARVRVESLGGAVEVARADAHGDARRLTSGEVHESALTDEVVVTVPGAVRVVLEPEAGGHARKEELVAAREELATTLADAGVASLPQLETAAEVAAAAQGAVRDLRRDLQSMLSGRPRPEVEEALAGQVPRTLVTELGVLRARRTAHRPDDHDRPLPSDLGAAREVADAAAAELQQRRDERRRLVTEQRERQQAAALLRARLDRADGQLESLRQQADRATHELADARAVMSDEAIEEELRRRSTVLAQAEAEESAARRVAAAADVERARATLASLARRLESAEEQHRADTASLHSLAGQVEMAQSEGRRELYDLAVADLDEHERRLASLDRQARAARHLWRTLTEHRDRAHATYALPYTRALEELGRRVYGDGFGVTVDDQLVLRSRTLDGSTVPFEELSGGAKEQLGILARLAVARLVDPTQGVPVVIDDALGYSDPDRLRQMGEVLGASAAGADVQVILLTCTPDRYAAVPDARTVRLTA